MTLSTARITIALIIGLTAGLILHLVMILITPLRNEQNSWQKLAGTLPVGELTEIIAEYEKIQNIIELDPAFIHSVCLFDLQNSYLEFSTQPSTQFWSVALFNSYGLPLHSFTNQDVGNETQWIYLVMPDGEQQLREHIGEAISQRILITTELPRGILVYRIFTGSPGEYWQALDSLEASHCKMIALN